MAYSPQKRISPECGMLNEKGQLSQCGFDTTPFPGFERSDIAFLRRMNIREWDSYTFGNGDWQVSVSIADCERTGLAAVSAADIRNGKYKTAVSAELFSLGSLDLPNRSDFGDIVYRSKNTSLNISLGQNERRLTLRISDFDDVKELYISAVFTQPKEESLSAAIPFRNKNEFFLCRRINCMSVSAVIRCAGLETRAEDGTAFGCYEWVRGVLPSYFHRINCQGFGIHEGHRFGLFFSEGFGERSECGENGFFYNGKLYKIGELDIAVPEDRQREAWSFIGEEGDVNLRMVPTLHMPLSHSSHGLAKMVQNRVIGRFYGTVMLRSEDGTVQRLVLDGIEGFSEVVDCRW